MARFVWIALAVAVTACGSVDDNRPLDAQYVTAAILAPACGAAECHSAFSQSKGYEFDTLASMRKTIVEQGLVVLDSNRFDPSAPEGSSLITWLTKTDPFNLGMGRMPLEAPMPNEDIHFLEDWIRGPVKDTSDGSTCSVSIACLTAGAQCKIPSGSSTGTCVTTMYTAPAKGAQCNPKSFGGLACINKTLYQCGDDWNVSTMVRVCDGDCAAGACL
ncbi:MAG TPA: hypothetical protein VFQ65_29870 [Kofleriaceae bacterium]|nr:hypothetical protein [Kofleriaceae bacterium]